MESPLSTAVLPVKVQPVMEAELLFSIPTPTAPAHAPSPVALLAVKVESANEKEPPPEAAIAPPAA